jgi:hypothetical protein
MSKSTELGFCSQGFFVCRSSTGFRSTLASERAAFARLLKAAVLSNGTIRGGGLGESGTCSSVVAAGVDDAGSAKTESLSDDPAKSFEPLRGFEVVATFGAATGLEAITNCGDMTGLEAVTAFEVETVFGVVTAIGVGTAFAVVTNL